MKIHDADIEFMEDVAELRRKQKIVQVTVLVLFVIFLLVVGWVFSDEILSALERDDYKRDRIINVRMV